MLKEEFNRLMALFHDAAEGKMPSLEEIFSQSLEFFEHLKQQIAKGSPDERKEALRMMSEMYAQMIAESRRISERSGMTEEQLVSFAENPANFTPDQWASIQSSKEKIMNAGNDLARTIESSTKGEAAAAPIHPTEKKTAHHPKEKKTKKSGWMRS